MALSRNLAASLASSVLTALLRIAVVPLYLRYLGIDAYGLVGFFTTTQALFQILDFGMAPTINREVARCAATGSWDEARRLLHTFAVISWAVALAIAVMMMPLASVIARHWLNAGPISVAEVTRAVALIGIAIACRWPIGVYQGALNGAQRLATTSAISAVMACLSSLGAVAILAFVSPTISAFFIWQAAVGFVYAFTLRTAAWIEVGNGDRLSFDFGLIRGTWRFSSSMLVLSILGIIFAQLDKVLLSKFLSLGEFGGYMVATTCAGALSIFIMPFYNSLYPRFSNLVRAGELEQLDRLYRLSGRLLAAVLLPIAAVMAVFSDELLAVWTGKRGLAHNVAPVLTLLATGTALHGLMYIPNALQLALGKTFVPLTINIVLLAIMVPVTVTLALRFGAMGGAMAWVILHMLYVVLSIWLQDRYIRRGAGLRWLIREIGTPLLIAVAAVVPCLATEELPIWPIGHLLIGSAIGAAAIVLAVGESAELRSELKAAIRREFPKWRAYG